MRKSAATSAISHAARVATHAPNEKPPTMIFLPGWPRRAHSIAAGTSVLLALAFFVLAAAGPDASKVEAQGRDVRVFESARRAKHDFVVQRAAA